MTDTAVTLGRLSPVATSTHAARHSATVRVTHWITALCVLALLISGLEIVVSHPRFYWGENGNVLMAPLFSLPIPASRATVPTGYGYVLPDQNGWSRYLHFEAAWVLVLTGGWYVIAGLISGHFRRNLLPIDRSWRAVSASLAERLRFRPAAEADAWSYNLLQRLAYLGVIFGVSPLLIWTGLAMSPAIESAIPSAVAAFGGRQSARTLHFLLTIVLVLFVLVHVVMVWMAGFTSRAIAMVTGRAAPPGRAE